METKRAKVIAIANQKGGVGKTTTAVNLAAALSQNEYSVLAIDLDAQGNLSACFGIEADEQEETIREIFLAETAEEELPADYGIIYNKSGVDILPSNIKLADIEMQLITDFNRERLLKSYLERISENYDFIIIDCSPSLSILTINALAAADKVIIPALPHHLSAIGLTQLMKTIQKVKRSLNRNLEIEGILLTQYSNRTNLAKNMKEEIESQYGNYTNVFSITIPQCVKAAEAGLLGKSVIEYAPNSSVAKAYTQFAELIGGAKNE